MVQGVIDTDITAVLNNELVATDIANKLNAKEVEYAPRITDVESQLAEKETQIEELQKNPNVYTGAVFTPIDDDCNVLVKDIWQPILDARGFKMSFACITGYVDTNPEYLTKQDLLYLQSNGNDIISHTVSHSQTDQTTDLKVLANEYKNSQQWLRDNGFKGYDVLVYPGGMGAPTSVSKLDIKKTARKYYRYAVATDTHYNKPPIDNWNIVRINIDILTLAEIKTEIDLAVSNNAWLVACSHTKELNKDRTNNIAKINGMIDYLQSKNVPILPFSEAEKLKGNAVAIGEYTDVEGIFCIT